MSALIPPRTAALADAVEQLQQRALKVAERALSDDDPLGDVPWALRSTRVAVGVMLAAKAADHARERDAGHRAFGLLIMRERIRDHGAWEEHAAKVDGAPGPVPIDAQIVAPEDAP